MKILKLFLLPILLMVSTSVSAVLIDFKAMGNGALGYGESAWDETGLNSFLIADFGIDMDIEGRLNKAFKYAYLDYGNAGLGVCSNLTSFGDTVVNTKRGSSGTNLCDPSSDDNVTTQENLMIRFNEAVTIDMLWFNNNHDPDYSLIGNTIIINGVGVIFGAGDLDGTRGNDVLYSSLLSFDAGDALVIANYDEEFYLSAMNIYERTVPEPASLAILGLGMIGLAFARRRAA